MSNEWSTNIVHFMTLYGKRCLKLLQYQSWGDSSIYLYEYSFLLPVLHQSDKSIIMIATDMVYQILNYITHRCRGIFARTWFY